MLVASLAYAPAAFAGGLEIEADAVEGSTTITITGQASSSDAVTVMVIAPNGNVVSIDQLSPDSDGSFTSTIGVGGPSGNKMVFTQLVPSKALLQSISQQLKLRLLEVL